VLHELAAEIECRNTAGEISSEIYFLEVKDSKLHAY
jgi:hypothetical protein